MGYRHYIGYIKAEDYEKIKNEAQKIEDGYERTNFMQEKATQVLELGKLYWSNVQPIIDALYEHKTEDFSNDNTEFFVVDDNKLLLHVSYAMSQIWAKCIKEYQQVTSKILNEQKLTQDEQLQLFELDQLLIQEIQYAEKSAKLEKKGWEFPAYNNWQWNYVAAHVYDVHKNFDYSDKIMVVYGY